MICIFIIFLLVVYHSLREVAGIVGEYWVVGVDIEQYEEQEPDKYLRGLWQKHTDSKVLKTFRNYFSIVASPPVSFENFTALINEYRKKPPFNFSNPIDNLGGVVQVTKQELIFRILISAVKKKSDFLINWD